MQIAQSSLYYPDYSASPSFRINYIARIAFDASHCLNGCRVLLKSTFRTSNSHNHLIQPEFFVTFFANVKLLPSETSNQQGRFFLSTQVANFMPKSSLLASQQIQDGN